MGVGTLNSIKIQKKRRKGGFTLRFTPSLAHNFKNFALHLKSSSLRTLLRRSRVGEEDKTFSSPVGPTFCTSFRPAEGHNPRIASRLWARDKFSGAAPRIHRPHPDPAGSYPSRMDSLQQYRLSNFCFVTESLTFMAGTQSFPALDNWYSLPEIGEKQRISGKIIPFANFPFLISGGGSILPSKGIFMLTLRPPSDVLERMKSPNP